MWIDITGTLKHQWIKFQVFGLRIISSLYVQLPFSVAPAPAQALDLSLRGIREKPTGSYGEFYWISISLQFGSKTFEPQFAAHHSSSYREFMTCMLLWEVKFNNILYQTCKPPSAANS